MSFKKQINFLSICFSYGFIISLIFNFYFFEKLNKYFLTSGSYSLFEIFFTIFLFVLLWFSLTIIFLAIGFRYILKPFIIILLIISSFIFYYRSHYGVLVDEGIIISAFEAVHEKNFHEIYDLLGIKLLPILIFFAFIPSIPLFFIKIIYPNFIKELFFRILSIFGMLIIFSGLVAINYKDISLTGRTIKNYNREIIPHYFLTTSLKTFKKYIFKENYIYRVLDERPSTNLNEQILGIVVVGETARADHFSLNGYKKKTNPMLEKQNLINYKKAKSCGTLTKTSVPCMFFLGDYISFSENKARYQSNALDIISAAGVDVHWIENNSSCKNVCQKIKTTILNPNNTETYDELLLEETVKFINKTKNKKGLIILHMMGSHGPKYYKRYPKQFEKFQPSCKVNTPQDCSREELINAYDNTILYTDYILNSLIEILKKENLKSFLIYASDHGESLGENGLYLHGVPMKFAPKEQTHIPLFIWLSKNYNKNKKFIFTNTNENISHENFPYTILELMNIKSKTHKKEKSLIQQ